MANLHITNNLNAESLPVMGYLVIVSMFLDHIHIRLHSKSKNQSFRYAFSVILHSHFKEMGHGKSGVKFK